MAAQPKGLEMSMMTTMKMAMMTMVGIMTYDDHDHCDDGQSRGRARSET